MTTSNKTQSLESISPAETGMEDPTCPHGQPLHQDCFICSETTPPEPQAGEDAELDALNAALSLSLAQQQRLAGRLLKNIAAVNRLSPTAQPVSEALSRAQYVASTSDDGEYQLKIGFANLTDLQEAHAALQGEK